MNRKLTSLLILVSLILLVSLSCQALSPNSRPTLVGTWKGEYDDAKMIFVFYDDGYLAVFIDGGLQEGGTTYEADYSTSPAKLDILSINGKILTIFEFIDDNTIRMENNDPDANRPTSFSDFIILQREP